MYSLVLILCLDLPDWQVYSKNSSLDNWMHRRNALNPEFTTTMHSSGSTKRRNILQVVTELEGGPNSVREALSVKWWRDTVPYGFSLEPREFEYKMSVDVRCSEKLLYGTLNHKSLPAHKQWTKGFEHLLSQSSAQKFVGIRTLDLHIGNDYTYLVSQEEDTILQDTYFISPFRRVEHTWLRKKIDTRTGRKGNIHSSVPQ